MNNYYYDTEPSKMFFIMYIIYYLKGKKFLPQLIEKKIKLYNTILLSLSFSSCP